MGGIDQTMVIVFDVFFPLRMGLWDPFQIIRTPWLINGWVVVSKIFYFHPLLGEDSHFDEHIFQMG